jgi:hypothetical protein
VPESELARSAGDTVAFSPGDNKMFTHRIPEVIEWLFAKEIDTMEKDIFKKVGGWVMMGYKSRYGTRPNQIRPVRLSEHINSLVKGWCYEDMVLKGYKIKDITSIERTSIPERKPYKWPVDAAFSEKEVLQLAKQENAQEAPAKLTPEEILEQLGGQVLREPEGSDLRQLWVHKEKVDLYKLFEENRAAFEEFLAKAGAYDKLKAADRKHKRKIEEQSKELDDAKKRITELEECMTPELQQKIQELQSNEVYMKKIQELQYTIEQLEALNSHLQRSSDESTLKKKIKKLEEANEKLQDENNKLFDQNSKVKRAKDAPRAAKP